MSIFQISRKNEKLILSGILILHLLFVLGSMNQPFHGDENVVFEAAKAVLISGKPVFQYGISNPDFQGLWHPPTYIYIVSVFIAIFGDSIYALRMAAGLFNFITVILVYLISKEIFRNNKNNFFPLLAVALYALNPLAIQSSVLMDFDGGILNFSIYLFIYLFIKSKSYYYLIPSLVLVFFSKFSGVILLFISLIFFNLLTKNFKNIKKAILMFIISGLLFLGIFWIYTYSFGLDFTKPFKHSFNFGNSGAGLIHTTLLFWIRSAWSFKGFFYFAVPFFVFLFFWMSVKFYKKIIHERTLKNKKEILFINLFAMVNILFFFYLGASGWGFPKYYINALPAMSLFISYMISEIKFLNSLKKAICRKNVIYLALIPIMTIYFVLVIPSPLMPEFDSTAQNANLPLAVKLIAETFSLYFIIPLAITFLFLLISRMKNKLIIALFFLVFFCYFYLNIIHAFANSSTYFTYGDYGILQVVDYLKENNISPENTAAYPNIGSYIGFSKYYEITSLYTNPKIFKEKAIENKNIKYIIIYERDIGRIGDENMDYFYLEKKIGTYYIFRKI